MSLQYKIPLQFYFEYYIPVVIRTVLVQYSCIIQVLIVLYQVLQDYYSYRSYLVVTLVKKEIVDTSNTVIVQVMYPSSSNSYVLSIVVLGV